MRFYCVPLLEFSAENILWLFSDRSRRAQVDTPDIKFVFCRKNWLLGFIIPLNIKVTLSKTKHLLVENVSNEPSERDQPVSTKSYNFSLGRIYFISNDGCQKTFVCQPTFNMLELKKDKVTEYIIGWR